MPKCVIGYIDDTSGWEEKDFVKIAKTENVELVVFNMKEKFSEKELKEKADRCDIIYNDTSETLALEIVKTFEQMGKKVIEESNTFYYSEDKWMLYLKCRENNILVPETQILSMSINGAKKDLIEFGQWPVILKRIDCYGGNYIEKADNINQALKIINRFWEKTGNKMPIIAQEFIKSYCYRILLINKKIVQAALKRGKGWKLTGKYAKRFWKFKPDSELIEISKKIADITKIKVLGIDLLKKNGKWLVLEANAQPSFSFFDTEKEQMIKKVIDFLIKEASC
jgi:glutathione synthase/RimK-type ligase-like ATP-grasp enzyme